jgi:hypothetical protein
MNCIICNSPAHHFLSKTFTEKPLDQIMAEIGQVSYHKCSNCGFTFSKTHFDLDDSVWGKLNYDFHALIAHGEMHAAHGNYPPYLEQALMVHLLSKNQLVSTETILDYAGGTGTFSDLLSKYFDIPSLIYEPYMHRKEDPRFITREELGQYDIVFNSAMFEHIRSRSDLDEVNCAVASDGALIIHSVICENIPADPDWFYYRPPVHCAFHTNKSMGILMEQWGYSCSAYSPQAKCWVLFKKKPADFEKRLSFINNQIKDRFFYFEDGFVSFWKGF